MPVAAVAAVAGFLAAGLVAPAAQANPGGPGNPGDVVIDKADPAGDVRIFDYDGPSTALRKSIDLRHFTVIEGEGETRFVVRLKRIVPGGRFHQIVQVQLRPAADDQFWYASLGFSPQQPARSYADYSPTLDGDQARSCDGLRAVVQRSRNEVRVDVPDRCLPDDPALIRVSSHYGPYRAEGVGYSQDRLRIPGAHALQVVS